jgi:hypothetical protein
MQLAMTNGEDLDYDRVRLVQEASATTAEKGIARVVDAGSARSPRLTSQTAEGDLRGRQIALRVANGSGPAKPPASYGTFKARNSAERG